MSRINVCNQAPLTPSFNCHRPCFFPETRTDPKGTARTVYHDETRRTPYEKRKALPKSTEHWKPGIMFEILAATGHRLSDKHAVDLLQQTRQQLFTTIHDQTHNTG